MGVSGRSWVDFQCFYALWWRSRWLWSGFYVLFHYFWPSLSLFGAKKTCQNRLKMGQKWAKNGSFLGDFGPFLGCFGVTLGSLWSQFGIVLASFWGCFEVVSTSFWGLLPHFWVILGLFCVFTVFLWIFGAVLRLPMQKFTKMRQYSASICNFFVKIDQKMGKFIQKQAFYRLLNTCIA